jgi:hypothetical protein
MKWWWAADIAPLSPRGRASLASRHPSPAASTDWGAFLLRSSDRLRMSGLPGSHLGRGAPPPEPRAGIRVPGVADCRSWRAVVRSEPGLSKISRLARGMSGFARIARRPGMRPCRSQGPGFACLACPTAESWTVVELDFAILSDPLPCRASCRSKVTPHFGARSQALLGWCVNQARREICIEDRPDLRSAGPKWRKSRVRSSPQPSTIYSRTRQANESRLSTRGSPPGAQSRQTRSYRDPAVGSWRIRVRSTSHFEFTPPQERPDPEADLADSPGQREAANTHRERPASHTTCANAACPMKQAIRDSAKAEASGG